ncbi:hypothetical protein [Segniliparus rugosus]|uniref:Uncharacterized protein n=1 Tax=Segniliparus rugosus (strain ATCC BAA-974 / DSM 45345 / CCUG 50838 / CIP 108380 / JCM 13579 / CDC 945) TaxID=679197 RepID=E5XV52_SEGRC|nr:hypothetical protein [Segniliparus rugosus]EFV11757.2 hypothetical protein HMPREF9336_03374 [Segniliparus rugosus ATCC BAA-974]
MYTYLGNHFPPTDHFPWNATPNYHNEYIMIARPGSVELKQGDYGTVDGSEEPSVHITKPISGATWSALLAAANRLPEPSTSHPYLARGDFPVEAELYQGETSVRRGFYSDAATVQIHDIFLKVFPGLPGLSPR